MPGAHDLLRRFLPEPTRTGRRFCDPVTGVPFRSLVMVDVELETGTVAVRAARTPHELPPEGVYAVFWWHGQPVHDAVVGGDPDDVLPGLLDRLREELEPPLVQHQLEDALAAPDGLTRARADGLRGVPHGPAVTGPLPSITVAVCTRDRPDALRDCLQALSELRHPVLEVLVVDNASRDDATRRVAAEFPFVRCVVEPRPGLDWARNRALHEATGDVVAYTDDDVLVHPGWAGALARAFAIEPAAACVTGLVLPAELATPAQVLFEVQGGFNRGFRRRWFGAAVEAGEVAGALFGGTGGAGTGASMALCREKALELGGFDTALDVGTPTGGGGDLEMFFRVVAAGHQLLYEPAAVVHHRHRTDLPGLHRQMHGNGTGSFAYLVGAANRYGGVQGRALRRVATHWFVPWHARQWLRGIAAPELLPPSLRAAERRGAREAVVRRLYRQAERTAAARAAQTAGPELVLRRPGALPPPARQPDPSLDVDLSLPVTDDRSAARAPGASRRTRIQVLRAGRLQHVLTLANHGAAPSAALLRHELAARLGPALVVPGSGGTDVGGDVLGAELHQAPSPGFLKALLDGPVPEWALSPVPDTVSVSVVMATRDRPALLEVSLDAIARQRTRRVVQVVVVDNSADPAGTARLVAQHDGMTVLHEPRPGLSRARNTGLRAVTGELVVFVDDDVVVPQDWLESLISPFADERVGAVAGNVLPADVTSLAAQVFEDYGGLGRGPLRRTYLPEWLDRPGGPAPTWQIGATANAAFRRACFTRLGAWDEALGAGTAAGVGEDTEFLYRVLRAGWRVAYEPEAAVLHHHRPDLAALARQLRAYSAGHVAYHLQLLVEHGDARGLRRVVVSLPRSLVSRRLSVGRYHDDYPPSLLRAEVAGHLAGPWAWWTSRRAARLPAGPR